LPVKLAATQIGVQLDLMLRPFSAEADQAGSNIGAAGDTITGTVSERDVVVAISRLNAGAVKQRCDHYCW